MKHSIPNSAAGPFTESMRTAVEKCVHCGFCLPACPTYQELGQEADSPRGRIVLMKQVLEDELDHEEVSQHIDRCLGCLACETACPSGVQYRDLISTYRATHRTRKRFWERVRDRVINATIPYPGRFRWALRLARWTRWVSFLAPRSFRPLTELVPDVIPAAERMEKLYASRGQKTMSVALLAGCAQQVIAPEINRHTIDLLVRLGVEVQVPPSQGCCGALAWHNGNAEQARKLARVNLKAFPESVDYIVTNAAGCGSGIKEYELLFADTPDQEVACAVAEKTIDISVLLERLGFANRIHQESHQKIRVAYQDACHLSHGQGVRSAPRKLLQAIPGVELVPLADPDICCGSAGTYNIDQPEIAMDLGRRKAMAVQKSGAEIMVTGNIGCLVQIRKHLAALGSPVRAMHLVQFLAENAQIE